MTAKLTSLEYLRIINNCQSVRSIPLGIFPKLWSVTLRTCENLESLSIEGVAEKLSQLGIYDCPNMVSFSHGGLRTPNLAYLSISGCQNLKSLPEEIHTLATLQHLSIINLPNLVSFAEGGLPPNLQFFEIDNCDRLRSSVEWALQGLVSLLEFSISGRGSDEIMEKLLKEQLLPTNLSTLCISHLSGLESLDGNGLQHLTSLQELIILCCDNLQFLPRKGLQHLISLQELRISGCDRLQFLPEEDLPASLSYLWIYKCSALEKRYQNKMGEDWAKISHIP